MLISASRTMEFSNRILLKAKRRLQNQKPYIIASEIKQVFRKHLQPPTHSYEHAISLKPEGSSRGNALLSIWNEPFIFRPGEVRSHSYHSHFWESLEMARTFLEFGYSVDVIHYMNKSFTPKKHYSVLVDERWNIERLSALLADGCVKIMHLDTAHLLFHNAAECRRLFELQQRRGVTLRPRRFELPNLGLEYADCATVLGNDFTINTYKYANKPLYNVPLTSPSVYPWPEDKNFEKCRKNFLWFASGGMVHKGLDLVLEAFAEMPDYHLTVCGPVREEKDFEQAFDRELYHTPNIQTVGWTDIFSREFVELTRSCVGLVYPSCSEGQAASVITCLQAGLIPIMSYESGVDADDFGFILKDCSVSQIKDTVQMLSSLPAAELEKRARRAWECARENYTAEKFRAAYGQAIQAILNGHGENGKLTCHTLNNAMRTGDSSQRSMES